MGYRGMGQVVVGGGAVVAAAPARSVDWAAIERFARREAGGGMRAVFDATGTRTRSTAALRALADTVAVRDRAVAYLMAPASSHRQGLLSIADYARGMASAQRRDANALVASQARALAAGRGGLVAQARSGPGAAMVAPARASTAPVSSASDEALLARVRAELQKPRQQWHRDIAEVVATVEASNASPEAGVLMLKRVMASTSGDAKVALAVMVVTTEDMLKAMRGIGQQIASSASQPSGSSPPSSSTAAPATITGPGGQVVAIPAPASVSGIGNYTY